RFARTGRRSARTATHRADSRNPGAACIRSVETKRARDPAIGGDALPPRAEHPTILAGPAHATARAVPASVPDCARAASRARRRRPRLCLRRSARSAFELPRTAEAWIQSLWTGQLRSRRAIRTRGAIARWWRRTRTTVQVFQSLSESREDG